MSSPAGNTRKARTGTIRTELINIPARVAYSGTDLHPAPTDELPPGDPVHDHVHRRPSPTPSGLTPPDQPPSQARPAPPGHPDHRVGPPPLRRHQTAAPQPKLSDSQDQFTRRGGSRLRRCWSTPISSSQLASASIGSPRQYGSGGKNPIGRVHQCRSGTQVNPGRSGSPAWTYATATVRGRRRSGGRRRYSTGPGISSCPQYVGIPGCNPEVRSFVGQGGSNRPPPLTQTGWSSDGRQGR